MILILYGVLCYLCGCGTIAIFAGVRDATHIDWLERDLYAARAAAWRLDQERLRLINGSQKGYSHA